MEEKEKEIMDFMAVYGEAGMIGVVGVMFVYLVVSDSEAPASDVEQSGPEMQTGLCIVFLLFTMHLSETQRLFKT